MSQELTGAYLEDFRRDNLAQVWRLYRLDKRLSELTPVLHMSGNDRDWLLRHHKTAPIKAEEAPARQKLDKLLHLCGVLEAGWRSGAIAEQIPLVPPALIELVLLPEVRAYYSERYPLAHIGAFLERIRGGRTAPVYFQPAWFAALLRLDSNIRDKKLVKLLMIVDGYWFGSVNYRSLRSAVKRQISIIDAVITPADERSPLQSALAGLEAFALFCDDLQSLLNLVHDKRELQDAAFDLYRYWFLVRGEELKVLLERAISVLSAFPEQVEAQPRTSSSIELLFKRAHASASLSA